MPARQLIWPSKLAGPVQPVEPEQPQIHCVAVTTGVMTGVHDFAVDLAKVERWFGEIKELVDFVYRDKASRKTAIYAILKKVKEGKNADD